MANTSNASLYILFVFLCRVYIFVAEIFNTQGSSERNSLLLERRNVEARHRQNSSEKKILIPSASQGKEKARVLLCLFH